MFSNAVMAREGTAALQADKRGYEGRQKVTNEMSCLTFLYTDSTIKKQVTGSYALDGQGVQKRIDVKGNKNKPCIFGGKVCQGGALLE